MDARPIPMADLEQGYTYYQGEPTPGHPEVETWQAPEPISFPGEPAPAQASPLVHSQSPDATPPTKVTSSSLHGRQDHKDSLNRYACVTGPNHHKDHFFNPESGKLELLRVQHAQGYTRPSSLGAQTPWSDPQPLSPAKDLWKRIRKTPMDILSWTYGNKLTAEAAREGAITRSLSAANDASTDVYWKYPIACLILTLTSLFGNFEGKSLPGGRYPPVRYTYFAYPKKPRNVLESQKSFKSSESSDQSLSPHSNQPGSPNNWTVTPSESNNHQQVEDDGEFVRNLRPLYLCIIRPTSSVSRRSRGVRNQFEVVSVEQWDRQREESQSDESGEYIFVSYTRKQFHSPEDPTAHNRPANDDLDRLCEIGIEAARKANLTAFWIDVLCMPDLEQRKMEAYRICDVARGCNRMVIALKDTPEIQSSRAGTEPSVDNLLPVWSSRLWTLPEMLLAPTHYNLEIYFAGNTIGSCGVIPKRSMASRAYPSDGKLVRQLVEHFEANQQLTPVELLTLGLECMVSRPKSAYSPADPIYALMTLSRRRPPPNRGEGLFEAFAKLSLLNDSNSLLERLICILPPARGEPWYTLKDFWRVKLWDIDPSVQVAAIADEQTVILDGAFGASIEWSELRKVSFVKRKTIWRSIGSFIVRFAPGWLIIAIVMLAEFAKAPIQYYDYETFEWKEKPNPLIGVAIAFFLVAFFAVAILPYAMLSLYGGKFWSTEALLFGMEGRGDLETLEKALFGFYQGRLRWSPHGSTLSDHRLKPRSGKWIDQECEATPPLEETPLREGHEPVKVEELDPDRLFTIVDTYSMTVTLIRAVHPPSVALVCGHEGGMRRTLLCSYDYRTQTFHRETVIRMPTKVLDRMDRVDKFRFSMVGRSLDPRKVEELGDGAQA